MGGVSGESALVADTPERLDIFGEPKIAPRVGDGYQANIPSMVLLADDNQQTNSHNDKNITIGVSYVHLTGLPIAIERTVQPEDHFCDSNDFRSGSKFLDELDSSSWHYSDVGRNRGKGHYLVTASEVKQWSEIEEAGFLMGLYVFGKNFDIVKKFVGKEKMGDVMSFYYGKFYRSRQHKRWSECRNNKSRKCVYGHKIFTGSRQQEFVSRLIASVAEELRGALLEVSKTYAMGNISVEEYIFNLKGLVGMERLVKAVAVGKGKKDLTCPSADISKSIQALHTCLEVPAGKAWSSLTTSAIIDFLTGTFRLSKAKSIDLFWEAVWPRLLARGWHSEQPKGYAYVSRSKQSLVFLVPGVKKFSRRKLVKGEDYFDSVSEILNKIAKEPTLLDLETQTDQGSNIKVAVSAKFDDIVEHRDVVDGHPAYLKPRDTNPDIEFIGLTVIDTALATTITGKARKVTYWPLKTLNIPSSSSQFEKIDNNILEEPRQESDFGETCFIRQNASNSNALNMDHTISRSYTNGQVSASLPSKITIDMTKSADTEDQLRRNKSRLKRSVDHNGLVDTLLAAKKPRKLTVYSHQETGQNAITSLLYDHSSEREDKESIYHNIIARIPQMGSLAPGSANHSSQNDTETSRFSLNSEHPQEECRPRMVIDLNLPYNSDNDLDGVPGIEMKEMSSPEQGPAIDSRRHSTRNRPLTAKVLDAIADGLFEVAPKRKRGQSSSPDCNNVRSSQQVRATSNGTMNIGFGARRSLLEGNGASGASINSDMLRNFQSQPMADSTCYLKQAAI